MAGVLVLAIVLAAMAFLGRPYYTMGMPYYGGGWFYFPFGFILVFFIIFVVGRVLFWPWGWRRGYGRDYGDAKDILRRRYARGEITKEQFDQMIRDIQQNP